ncbi:helix-turn-helix transcriptional regulator [Pseudomonas gregormendelii]|uniref:Helix-turn-helix transcriptional regulator n=1 Tax=Pseudomonas gregormendelii TaxID=1628277 RepID=A0ABS3AM34_9PSED|nr:helix-turn-helix transcriptional regulator [Pseudomonas gregormendelii]MBN3968224.1 helix-turn-helix transcriptional regulator [Pseudomonas gregormendelii]
MTISNRVKEEDQTLRDIVAKRLKRARHAAGFTMAAVADRLGYTNLTMISLFENGRRAPSLKITLRFADLYCVTTDYLLGRTDDIGLAPEEGNQAMITGVLKGVLTSYNDKYLSGLAAVTAIAVEGASMDRVLLGKVADISVELSDSLAVVRKHHGSAFESMRGGGKLERLINELSSSVESRILSKKREKALIEYEYPIFTAQQVAASVQQALFAE